MNRILPIASLAVAAAMCAAIAGCHSSSSGKAPQAGSAMPAAAAAMRVVAARPARKTLRRESVQPGQVEAFEQTPLFAKLPAFVEKLYVDIGDRVEAGQPLVDLFLPELKDELRQKEAAEVQAGAEIELAVAAIGAAEAAVVTAQANVVAAEAGKIRAEADYLRWQSQYARIRELVRGGAMDRKLEEETQNSLKAAEAAVGETRAKTDAAKATLLQSRAELAKAKANEAVARARYGNTEADLSRVKVLLRYTQIHSPYAGVVTERNVNRGDFVQPASTMTARPLLAVARADIVRVFVDVPEMDSPWVEAGQTGYVSVQAFPDRIVEGKVTRTSWVLGANRTLRTELDLPNTSGWLRPGMYATAHVLLKEHADVYVLPPSAIVREEKQTYCWVARGGRAVRIPIKLGMTAGDDVEVVSGLKGDDLVVQSPAASLQEGQSIEVAQPGGQ
jgi:RND family efflux transporter MFP subunit